MNVAGRTAVVTGGSRGIGRAIAAELVRRHVSVALVARPSADLTETARALGAVAIEADLTDRPAVAHIAEQATAVLGPVDIVINNAALVRPTAAAAMADVALVDDLECNLVAPMRLVRHLLPGMLERGRGHIVNVSSGAAALPLANMTTYCASKAALLHYTSALRSELWHTPIGATAVELGSVKGTAAYDTALQDPRMHQLHRRLSRLGLLIDATPEGVARATADAIEHDRKTVRLPGLVRPWWALNSIVRDASFYLFRAAPSAADRDPCRRTNREDQHGQQHPARPTSVASISVMDPIDVARRTYAAYVEDDREALEAVVAPTFTFSSGPDPLLDRDGYFERCWPNHEALVDFKLVRLVDIGDGEVLVTYEAERTDGTRFRNTEVLTVRDGQLVRAEVYFGWGLA